MSITIKINLIKKNTSSDSLIFIYKDAIDFIFILILSWNFIDTSLYLYIKSNH